MDFVSRQGDARARSRRFFWAFGVVIVLAVVIIYFAITGGFFAFRFSPRETASFYPPLPPSIYGYPPKVLSLKPFLIIGSVVTLIILSISIRRTRFIREGGGAYIADILGARLLETPANLKESQLINIVEEISVAAGLPRTRMYIITGIRPSLIPI